MCWAPKPKARALKRRNGSDGLDNEEKRAQMRVRAGSLWSNIARVTDAAIAARAEAAVVAFFFFLILNPLLYTAHVPGHRSGNVP
jgi:hypothetical protein